jgi:Cu+-exporting ATPase
MSIMVATGRGARAGVLVRDAAALERLARVDTLVVDKTGTLTEGRPSLVTVRLLGDVDERHMLRLAAGVERGSAHPLAAAIVDGAAERGVEPGPVLSFVSLAGRGVAGTVDGLPVLVGSESMLREHGVPVDALGAQAEAPRREGQTVVLVAAAGRPIGLLGIADRIKAQAGDALAALRHERLRIVLATGDSRLTAAAVARRLCISEVEPEIPPEGKGDLIRRLQDQGRVVAMAGDGINDAPALALADVGIAMGGGADVAVESAAVTLLHGDPRGIVRALRLSRGTRRNIRQNLLFAFAYNVLGVPLAAGVLYPALGVSLGPMIASAAMSLSSVSVIANALRLRRLSL